MYFLGFYEYKKTKFMEVLPLLIIYLFNYVGLDLISNMIKYFILSALVYY